MKVKLGVKLYHVQYCIGKAKYVVSYHDGFKKHSDGSDFFDVAIFKSRKAMHLFVMRLHDEGYNEVWA